MWIVVENKCEIHFVGQSKITSMFQRLWCVRKENKFLIRIHETLALMNLTEKLIFFESFETSSQILKVFKNFKPGICDVLTADLNSMIVDGR